MQAIQKLGKCSRNVSNPRWTCALNDVNCSLFQKRGYKRYRVPKTRFNYEIRPEPPPFFNKGAKFQESFMRMRKNSEEEQRSLIEGLDFPMLVAEERPRLIACSNAVASAFQPPKNESSLSQNVTSVRQKLSVTDMMAMRKIKSSMGDFNKLSFLETASEVYKSLMSELCRTPMKRSQLMQHCTEFCYPVLTRGLHNCQVTWKYVETVEPSRIVAAATNSFLQDDHEFGQIIVRMHSKQVMAIFDRFGRLLRGDPERPQTVLEYIVMERHMRPIEWSSHWRVHAKIHSNVSDDVNSHNVKMNLKTQVVPDSFVPQFPCAPPEEPVEDPSEWNKKWMDPGYYHLTEEEEREIDRERVRRRHKHDMHPTVRS